MKRRATLRRELDLESFDPSHPIVKQEQVDPPVLYETMRLQHEQSVMKEELMETTPTPFQSLIQHQSLSPIQHPFQSRTLPSMPSRERAWRSQMPDRFRQPPQPATPDRHWSPGPNYVLPRMNHQKEPSRSYEKNQQRRAAFREKRRLQRDSKCYDRFNDGYDMNWNKEAGPWEDLAQEDIEWIKA